MLASTFAGTADAIGTPLLVALVTYMLADARRLRTKLDKLEARLNARLAAIQDRLNRLDPPRV